MTAIKVFLIALALTFLGACDKKSGSSRNDDWYNGWNNNWNNSWNNGSLSCGSINVNQPLAQFCSQALNLVRSNSQPFCQSEWAQQMIQRNCPNIPRDVYELAQMSNMTHQHIGSHQHRQVSVQQWNGAVPPLFPPYWLPQGHLHAGSQCCRRVIVERRVNSRGEKTIRARPVREDRDFDRNDKYCRAGYEHNGRRCVKVREIKSSPAPAQAPTPAPAPVAAVVQTPIAAAVLGDAKATGGSANSGISIVNNCKSRGLFTRTTCTVNANENTQNNSARGGNAEVQYGSANANAEANGTSAAASDEAKVEVAPATETAAPQTETPAPGPTTPAEPISPGPPSDLLEEIVKNRKENFDKCLSGQNDKDPVTQKPYVYDGSVDSSGQVIRPGIPIHTIITSINTAAIQVNQDLNINNYNDESGLKYFEWVNSVCRIENNKLVRNNDPKKQEKINFWRNLISIFDARPAAQSNPNSDWNKINIVNNKLQIRHYQQNCMRELLLVTAKCMGDFTAHVINQSGQIIESKPRFRDLLQRYNDYFDTDHTENNYNFGSLQEIY